MDPIVRILPVFAVIGAGFLGKRFGFLPDAFQGPANRLVYWFAIPCLIFLKVVDAPFREILRPGWIAAAVAAIVLWWAAAGVLSGWLPLEPPGRGTFIQASIHANLGYIGLATAYYGLGEAGLQTASVYAPFFMLTNNVLAVLALGRFGRGARSPSDLAHTLLVHPVILAAFAGLGWSWAGWPLPAPVRDTLGILAGMALPLALLLIGAGLGIRTLKRPGPVALSTAIKNLALPAVGMGLLTLAGADGMQRAAAVVLLSAPSATLTAVLAREMGGDVELASAAITVSTLACAATLPLWLAWAGP